MTELIKPPLVSVIVAAYNQRPWIREALDSALTQTYPRLEVIVVDDGSTDGTGALVRDTYGSRVRLITQPNRGLPAVRNTGISAAQGNWVQFLDGDDLLAPEKINIQVAALREARDHDLAYCEFAYFGKDPDRRWTGRIHSPRRSGVLLPELLKGNFIVSHAALVRRSVLLESGGFDERLDACEDYDLWLRLAEAGAQFLFTPGTLALYRQRPGSMSQNHVAQVSSTLHVLEHVPDRMPLSRSLRRRHARALAFYQFFRGYFRILRALRHARRARVVAATRELLGATGDMLRSPLRLIQGLQTRRRSGSQ